MPFRGQGSIIIGEGGMRRGSDGVTLRVTNFPKKFYLFAFPPRGKVAFAKQMTDEGKLLYAQFFVNYCKN